MPISIGRMCANALHHLWRTDTFLKDRGYWPLVRHVLVSNTYMTCV